MKKNLIWAAALLLASCSPQLKVEVSNDTPVERDDETVEIVWSEIASLKGVTPENVIVKDRKGKQVPSQVIYLGTETPQSLIFQTDADPQETLHYVITTGKRENYRDEAYGRQVPERYDDYAWENNKVAYRLYGPALETSPEKLITPGIDVWVKSTDKLVIDERYKRGNYHHNYGDGMDCYKVGTTLGSGSSVPILDGRFWFMDHNYRSYKTLDNGPIRTTVRLTYSAFPVDTMLVSLTKTISLDANQRFNRMENVYEGNFTELPIASGFVRHEVKQQEVGQDWIAIREAASDSKTPEQDGDIYLAVILPDAQILPDTLKHALAVKRVKPGEKLTCFTGSGWSQGGIDDMKEWKEKVIEAQAAAVTPLKVVIHKK